MPSRVNSSPIKNYKYVCVIHYRDTLETRICIIKIYAARRCTSLSIAYFLSLPLSPFSRAHSESSLACRPQEKELLLSSAISPPLWKDSYFLRFKSLASGSQPCSLPVSLSPLSRVLPACDPIRERWYPHPFADRGGIHIRRSRFLTSCR